MPRLPSKLTRCRMDGRTAWPGTDTSVAAFPLGVAAVLSNPERRCISEHVVEVGIEIHGAWRLHAHILLVQELDYLQISTKGGNVHWGGAILIGGEHVDAETTCRRRTIAMSGLSHATQNGVVPSYAG